MRGLYCGCTGSHRGRVRGCLGRTGGRAVARDIASICHDTGDMIEKGVRMRMCLRGVCIG